MEGVSTFRNQLREYVQRLDGLRDSVAATNKDGNDDSVAEWLNRVGSFRRLLLEARSNAEFLAVDRQAATQYVNDIHDALGDL